MDNKQTPETDSQPVIMAINEDGYQVPCVDIEFARKLEDQRNSWEQTAAHYLDGMHYYRGLVEQIGKIIGIESYVQDDGGIVDSVLCDKVPELVEELKRERDEARARVEIITPSKNDPVAEYFSSSSTPETDAAWKEGKALDKMSIYLEEITGSCPYECFDIEPHAKPCSEVCDYYTKNIHKCWKQHFINQANKK